MHAWPIDFDRQYFTVSMERFLFTFCSLFAVFWITFRFIYGIFSAFHLHRSHLPLNFTRARLSFVLSRSIVTFAQLQDTSGAEPSSGVRTRHQPGSTYTPLSNAPQTHSTQPFLPGNGPIHLAPSLTHQPEILLLHRLPVSQPPSNHHHPTRTITLTGPIDILTTQQISHRSWTPATSIVKLTRFEPT